MAVKEEVYYEGGPHRGDLILNGLLAFTIVCLPLTIGAVVRALWLRYRITDRRVSITGGWRGQDRADAVYSEIDRVISVPRGLGIWGDMVLVLKDGSRLEMKAMPKFREVEAYINERITAKASTTNKTKTSQR
ncbi:MAG: ribonuclease P [Alkalinema sp. CACIAM 70d]|uniref:PH domain-containing protein n=1 Tax=Alkalinema sp. FACHB-956 TaxID=2692768 RepID=UPI000B63246B|nr:PH domain-containing protein [Alkalinema sp. FACHB-956]MBD2326586.1 PH domain-containing protein [Alkalinema sp. FACHB-956]OUC15527.1 MAG: ribonuclease P [Alkalinema sp. CACIAM 70d]